jgi:hypothetical protein
MRSSTVPVEISEPINACILVILEVKTQDFQSDPLAEISRQCGVELPIVVEWIKGRR